MSRRAKAEAAAFDSLRADTLRGARLLTEILAVRDGALEQVLGVRLPVTRMRETLMRTAILQLGEGRHQNITFYNEVCAHLGSSFAVRTELDRLAGLGALVLRPNPFDRRAVVIAPTIRLVRSYERLIDRLDELFRASLIDTESGRQGIFTDK